MGQVIVHVNDLLPYSNQLFLFAVLNRFQQFLLEFGFDYLQGILWVDLMVEDVDVLLLELIFDGEKEERLVFGLNVR